MGHSEDKYIFLDVDGVLMHYKKGPGGKFVSYGLDPKCVSRLNRILRTTGAKIVVSSCYRIGRSVPQLQELMDGFGVKGVVAGRTGQSDTRGLEVREWLDKNGAKAYAVLDDELDGASHVLGHYVQTKNTVYGPGLTKKEADEVIGILS